VRILPDKNVHFNAEIELFFAPTILKNTFRQL